MDQDCLNLLMRNVFVENCQLIILLLKDKSLLDIVVEKLVIVELKAIEQIIPIHQAQLLTYLKLSNLKLGLLINFNVPILKDGIKRLVNNL